MAMRYYPPEFKAEAVAVYRSRPGTTVVAVAGDLGGQRRDAAVLDPDRRRTTR
jgi:transposase